MKRKKHTIKSIAKEMEVSIATISFILNGKGREKGISKRMIDKVEAYCKEIDYRPNALAKSLRTGKSMILVVIVEDIYSKLARVIEELAYKKGYQVLFCSNNNDDVKSKKLISLFRDRKVDGFIIAPSPGIKDEIEKLQKEQFPIVLFDRYFSDLSNHKVISDNYQASTKVMKYLKQNAYRNILLITPDSEQTQILARINAYKDAVREFNLEEHIFSINLIEEEVEARRKNLKKRLSEDNFDAIFFTTGYLGRLGLEVMKDQFPAYLHSKGIFSYDDDILFKLFTPSISAVEQPIQKMGEALLEIILEEIDAKNPLDKKEIILESQLHFRESSQEKLKLQ